MKANGKNCTNGRKNTKEENYNKNNLLYTELWPTQNKGSLILLRKANWIYILFKIRCLCNPVSDERSQNRTKRDMANSFQ